MTRIDTRLINDDDHVRVMPCGLDMQGRYETRPMPAEAATEVGADDEDRGYGIVVGVAVGLALWGVFAALIITVWGV